MSFLKQSEIRQRAKDHINQRFRVTAKNIVMESEQSYAAWKRYDVFLSHSTKDADIVLGVKLVLEEQGKSVYVDWIEDAELDRTKVTPETAALLRERMKSCSSLIFIATDNSSTSKWTPWELGYFDGIKQGGVAILPVLEEWRSSFEGQEYLGLYPIVEKSDVSGGLEVKRKGTFQKVRLTDFIAS
ncbi:MULTISPECIES: toll/interleukin-1 receptor domain-containing protein [Janthinobacterium]|uniref:toll/interleukin-1 receptor domain-containing protein n=1 Tax=Janthinobacterium sp. SUN120 TaxID=3004099 RepID=UPI0025AF7EB3|nr:toll/interleukin-1 receptor domain-containing protein [Janthinobacterium sp. SUN120]MDN2714397.1 toll/interleukin-1 receptor domain-containing protein [Janthinobacterium sp. SUN120]